MQGARSGMKIRGQRKTLSTPKDFDTHWAVLSSAFNQIHNQSGEGLSYEQLYRASYQIVISKQADRLYTKLLEFESQWLKEQALTQLARDATQVTASVVAGSSSSNESAEKLIHELVTLWENYKLSVTLISDVLIHIDRSYCYRQQTYIADACVYSFRDLIIFGDLGTTPSTNLSAVIEDVIVQLLNTERRGFTINRPLLSSLIKMLDCMSSGDHSGQSVYHARFHKPIVNSSRQFFKKQAEELSRTNPPAQYFRIVHRLLTEDNDRCRSILTDQTASSIQDIIDSEMLEPYFEPLLHSSDGLRHLLTQGAIDDLSIIYTLNLRVSDKATHIANVARALVRDMGVSLNESIIKNSESPDAPSVLSAGSKPGPERSLNRQTVTALKWAEGLLDMKVKFDIIWEKAFKSNPFLQAEITNGFMEFINSPEFNRAPEYISLFIDAHLRKQSKDDDASQFSTILNQIVTLVRFVSSKDAVEMYYKKHLGKRLLLTKTSNIAFEKQLLTRLKQEWGNSATAKLEMMFRDIDISQNLTDSYKSDFQEDETDPQLQISILNSAAWPIENMFQKDVGASCVLPPEILKVRKSFEEYYKRNHSGRILTWQDGLGTVDLRATFSSVPVKGGGVRERKHELNVSVYAMSILMLFNSVPDGGSLSYTEIQERTQINEQDLIRNLQSLAIAPKTRILLKEPMSREIQSTDRFKFNDAFQSPFYKVKIGVVVANKVENEKEKKSSDKQLAADRLYGIQAVIVRLMKHHKTMRQTDLISECVQQIRTSFIPDIPTIKKGIEKAIEREFLDAVMEDGEKKGRAGTSFDFKK